METTFRFIVAGLNSTLLLGDPPIVSRALLVIDSKGGREFELALTPEVYAELEDFINAGLMDTPLRRNDAPEAMVGESTDTP